MLESSLRNLVASKHLPGPFVAHTTVQCELRLPRGLEVITG